MFAKYSVCGLKMYILCFYSECVRFIDLLKATNLIVFFVL